MTTNELLIKAKELVNSGVVKGYSAKPLQDAANTDLTLFQKYLLEIAEQLTDNFSKRNAIQTYGEELSNIILLLKPNHITETTKNVIKHLLRENLRGL